MKSRKRPIRIHTDVLTMVGMRLYVKLSATVMSTYRRPSICIRVASREQTPISSLQKTEVPPLRVALFIVQKSLLIAPLVCHLVRQVSSHLATLTAQLIHERGPCWANMLSQGMIIMTQLAETKQ